MQHFVARITKKAVYFIGTMWHVKIHEIFLVKMKKQPKTNELFYLHLYVIELNFHL